MIFVSETVGRDLASGGRAGTPINGHPDHPQPRKKQILRGLTNSTDEDIRLLSLLTRRTYKSID